MMRGQRLLMQEGMVWIDSQVTPPQFWFPSLVPGLFDDSAQ
jgi:hypothetical protein